MEELKYLVAKTEAEEKHQAEKYVRALKEGEKALEEKTAQLARTRNELQTQMIQFHELNSKINKHRKELREVQDNVKKGKDEVEELSQRRKEEKRLQELHVKVSWNARVYRVTVNGFRFCHCFKKYYIEDTTRWREDMNFMFEWQEQYLTSERSERVRYCSCHVNIKFISSSQRVMFFLLYRV